MAVGTGPATYTDLEVINMALLGRMGENRISDIDNDTSVRALVMREHYDQVVEDALTVTHWRFNTVKASLSKLAAEPLNRWSAAWQLPADFLRLLYTWPASNYEIQGQRIFTNETNKLEIDYSRYVESENWPPWFRRYVVAQLVMATKKGITGDDPTGADEKELNEARTTAFTQDAAQQPNFTDLPNPFVDVRR